MATNLKRRPQLWRAEYERDRNHLYLALIVGHPHHPDRDWALGECSRLCEEHLWHRPPNTPADRRHYGEDEISLRFMASLVASGQCSTARAAAEHVAKLRWPDDARDSATEADAVHKARDAMADRLARTFRRHWKAGLLKLALPDGDGDLVDETYWREPEGGRRNQGGD